MDFRTLDSAMGGVRTLLDPIGAFTSSVVSEIPKIKEALMPGNNYKAPLLPGHKPMYDYAKGEYYQEDPSGTRKPYLPTMAETTRFGFPNPFAASNTKQTIATDQRGLQLAKDRAGAATAIQEGDKQKDFTRKLVELRTLQENELARLRQQGSNSVQAQEAANKGTIGAAETTGKYTVQATQVRSDADKWIQGSAADASKYGSTLSLLGNIHNTNSNERIGLDSNRIREDEVKGVRDLGYATLEANQRRDQLAAVLGLIRSIQEGANNWATAAVAPFR